MTHEPTHDDQLLLRRLHGELTPDQRARLDDRLATEPGLRHRLDELEHAWNGLEAPPDPLLPTDFATTVRARAHHELSGWRWSTAPAWARAGMATALAVGMTLGLGVGRIEPTAMATAEVEASALVEDPIVEIDGLWHSFDEGSLAEEFWLGLDSIDSEPAEAGS